MRERDHGVRAYLARIGPVIGAYVSTLLVVFLILHSWFLVLLVASVAYLITTAVLVARKLRLAALTALGCTLLSFVAFLAAAVSAIRWTGKELAEAKSCTATVLDVDDGHRRTRGTYDVKVRVEPQGGSAHNETLTADIKPLRLSRIAAGENRYACKESRKRSWKIKIYWDSPAK
ncbi:hypothetical protein GCM10023196_025270 [Actinoallomurus vinaceus]|uniref:DUF4131 domain-containing protein n=1 Tax=Actinoallomurus vinaceus TaxID=1080074 RepID=A0ABP8U8T4_9ACTN